MGLAERLWHDNLDLARACLDDPFVAGLASGETPRDRFAWYVGQDAAFLEVFARAYSRAVPTAGSCSHSPSCCAA
jgi:thiaminase/transcriptional activator TenA